MHCWSYYNLSEAVCQSVKPVTDKHHSVPFSISNRSRRQCSDSAAKSTMTMLTQLQHESCTTLRVERCTWHKHSMAWHGICCCALFLFLLIHTRKNRTALIEDQHSCQHSTALYMYVVIWICLLSSTHTWNDHATHNSDGHNQHKTSMSIWWSNALQKSMLPIAAIARVGCAPERSTEQTSK